ncbi:hypothetical protein ES707_09603 [subsurface metagenome]
MTETRPEKAQRLVDEEQVEIVETDSFATSAFVQGDNGLYAVLLFASGRFNCICKWGTIHWNTDDLCAHALAVKLAMERKDKPC